MKARHMRVRGVPMRWEEHGSDGMPVVLVHGIPTSPLLWRFVIPRLSSGRALAWEMVGYGDSIPIGRERDISVARQADYLLGWLEALRIERAVLVGHDLGGGVVQIAAVQRPEICAGMVLTNSIGYDSWPIPEVKAARAIAPVARRLPDPLAKASLATLLLRGHDDRAMARECLDVHWRPYAAHAGAADLLRQMESLDVRDTLDVSPQLGRLDVPARVVWGAADRFQKVPYGARLAWDLRTELRRIEGGRHWTPEDHPDQIARAVDEVVAEAAG